MDGADELNEAEHGHEPPDRATEVLLERSFADVAAGIGPVRERVLARLAERAPRERPHARPIPFLGRRRRLFLLVNGIAAALLVSAYASYLALMPIQRQALATEARTGVRNLAIVLRTLRERPGAAAPATLAPALERLKIERDPFGNPYAFDAGTALVYSYGVNGRDERGSGDDIVAYAR